MNTESTDDTESEYILPLFPCFPCSKKKNFRVWRVAVIHVSILLFYVLCDFAAFHCKLNVRTQLPLFRLIAKPFDIFFVLLHTCALLQGMMLATMRYLKIITIKDMKLSDKVKNMNDGLTKTLGIEYHSTDDPETVEATMTCTPPVSQPWGFLSGGAVLALAENLAGIGSMSVTPEKQIFGINVAANHMSSVRTGESVTAVARLLRKGGTLHNWLVTVYNDQSGAIVSEIQVTNYTMSGDRIKK